MKVNFKISSFHHLIPIGQQKHSHHGQLLFLICWNLKKISSKTRRHLELLLCMNDVWKVLYKIFEPNEMEGSV
jgi:hypothetical protein